MDLIDRQALLKQIEIDSDGEPGYYGDTWKFIDTIKNLPSATGKNVGTKLSTNLASLGTDCISRQTAIDAVMECYDNDELFEVYEWKLNELPPIQPEPHWIPIDLENNEPPLEEWVLVSSDGYVMQDCIVERGEKKIWYHGGNIQVNDRYMPLPEPYKGVTE